MNTKKPLYAFNFILTDEIAEFILENNINGEDVETISFDSDEFCTMVLGDPELIMLFKLKFGNYFL